jgi:hypothetical protein
MAGRVDLGEWISERKRTHDAAPNERARCALRVYVRERCRRASVAVPAWARVQRKRRTTHRGTRPVARARSAERGLRSPDEPVTEKDRARSAPSAPASPAPTIPPELRAWRERTPGACVGIDRRGRVVLAEVGSVRRFASTAEAVEAVA